MERMDRILVEQIQKLNADMIGPTADEDTFDPVMTPRRIRKFVKRNSGKYKKKWSSLMMFFRRSVFEKIGYFDERFFATYEDTDLQKRMDDYGLTYFMISDFRIWHASQGTRKIEKMPTNYEIESLKKFIEKWGYDPRVKDHTFFGKLSRRIEKIKNRMGIF